MEKIIMDERLRIITDAIRSGGYDVRAQLIGYLQSGDSTYITRKDNARELILKLDINMIKEYVDSLSE